MIFKATINSNEHEKLEQRKTFYLWWEDKFNQHRYPAGVAFFDDQHSEFRLKIDAFPYNLYYLRAVSSHNEYIKYRLEIVIRKKDGQFKLRAQLGNGEDNPDHPDEVIISAYPFEKNLVLSLPKSDLKRKIA